MCYFLDINDVWRVIFKLFRMAEKEAGVQPFVHYCKQLGVSC